MEEKKNIDKVIQEIDDAQERLLPSSEQQRLRQRLAEIQTELAALKQQNTSLTSQLQESERKLRESQTKVETLNHNLKVYDREVQSLRRKIASRTNDLRTCKDVESENVTLKEYTKKLRRQLREIEARKEEIDDAINRERRDWELAPEQTTNPFANIPTIPDSLFRVERPSPQRRAASPVRADLPTPAAEPIDMETQRLDRVPPLRITGDEPTDSSVPPAPRRSRAFRDESRDRGRAPMRDSQDTIDELEDEKEFLQDEVNRLKRRLAAASSSDTTTAQKFKDERRKLQKEIDDLKKKLKDCLDGKTTLTSQLETEKTKTLKLTESLQQFANVLRSYTDQLRFQGIQLPPQFIELESIVSNLTDTLQLQMRPPTTFDRFASWFTADQTPLQQRQQQQQQEERLFQELRAILNLPTASREDVVREARTLFTQQQTLQQRVVELQRQLQQKEEEMQRRVNDLALQRGNENAQIQSLLEEADRDTRQLRSELQRTQAQLQSLQGDYTSLQSQLQQGQQRVRELESQGQSTGFLQQELQTQNTMLQSQLAAQQAELQRQSQIVQGVAARLQLPSTTPVNVILDRFETEMKECGQLQSGVQESLQALRQMNADQQDLISRLRSGPSPTYTSQLLGQLGLSVSPMDLQDEKTRNQIAQQLGLMYTELQQVRQDRTVQRDTLQDLMSALQPTFPSERMGEMSMDELVQLIQTLKQENSEKSDQLTQLELERRSIEIQLAQRNQELERLRVEMETRRQSTDDEILTLRNTIQELEKQLDEKNIDIQTLTSERNLLRRQIETLQTPVASQELTPDSDRSDSSLEDVNPTPVSLRRLSLNVPNLLSPPQRQQRKESIPMEDEADEAISPFRPQRDVAPGIQSRLAQLRESSKSPRRERSP